MIAIRVAKIIAKMAVVAVKAAVEKDAEDARDVLVSVEDVQDVRALAKAPVNLDAREATNIKMNNEKRHFIPPRVLQAFI